MARDRFVVLGLAHVRSTWFREVGRWSTNAAAPIDFVKCVSAEELQTIVGSGRAISAIMIDGGLPAVDRDLVERVRTIGAGVIVVDDGRVRRNWPELGVAAVIPPEFDRDDLLGVLEAHSTPIRAVDQTVVVDAPVSDGWRGHLVAVTGAGGVGTSTIAMAIAQGIAGDPRHRGLVALVDLALDADQALLHDAGDIAPGLQELVDAHRNGTPPAHVVHDFLFDVERRGYSLLVGLRQHRDWTVIRPTAFASALSSVRRAFRFVVADIEGDLEGEDETGSIDIEERNLLARHTATSADSVVLVGSSTIKGLRAIARAIRQLVALGVDDDRIIVVVNRAPRNPRLRAEISRAIATLSEVPGLRNPVFATDRKRIDQYVRDAVALPDAFCAPLARAVVHAITNLAPNRGVSTEPVRVPPGSLGARSAHAGPAEGLSA
jgi:MinD-like ATPase involved in chromosome partitioning or flagellar assembly